MLRKLALLAAVAALGLSLAGVANAKQSGPKSPPNGNAYGHGLGVSDGN